MFVENGFPNESVLQYTTYIYIVTHQSKLLGRLYNGLHHMIHMLSAIFVAGKFQQDISHI